MLDSNTYLKAKETLVELYENAAWDYEAPTMFMLFSDEGEANMVALPEGIPPELSRKLYLVSKIQKLANKIGANVCVFTSEGWGLENPEDRVPGERFSEHPDRVEVAMMNFETRDGLLISASAKIIREEGIHPKLEWREEIIHGQNGKVKSLQSIWSNPYQEAIEKTDAILSLAIGRDPEDLSMFKPFEDYDAGGN